MIDPPAPVIARQLWPVFICYRQVDGLAAAQHLYELLHKHEVTGANGELIEFDVYLDKTMPAVADWREIHRPYLEKARALIVVCTPGAKIDDGPEDWVHKEIGWWLEHRNTVPILVDPLRQGIRYVPPSIRERWPEIQRIPLVESEWAGLSSADLEQKANSLRRQIVGSILPSGAAIYDAELKAERQRAEQLSRALKGRTRALRWLGMALAATMVLLVVAAFTTKYAFNKRDEAGQSAKKTQRQLDRTNRALAIANQALAAGILADLDLKRDEPLTARQRNALWKLATADEAVRAHFISALSSSPEDLARIAAGFSEVCRALGLQWPSPADAEQLVAKSVAAVETLDKTAMSKIWQALAPKLIDAQAQQALAALLQRIGTMTDPNGLQAAAEGLKALSTKLSDEQVQQALAPLLQRIGNTTDPGVLQALAPVLRALSVKLSDAQAQQALAVLLHQIGNMTDPGSDYALLDLIQALQALPTNLTEVQAAQALAVLLLRIGKTTDPGALQALARAVGALSTKLSDAQAQQALAVLLQRIGSTTDPDFPYDPLRELTQTLLALPTKLTNAQAQQALAPLLQRIGDTTDPGALQALARAVGALSTKLSDAQAQQALAALLQRIGNTTDPKALRVLAEALQALSAKLTEAQAQQALALLLYQIGNTPKPYALRALAEALQVLPAKPTEAQAQQALAVLLQRVGNTTDPDALQALAEGLKALRTNVTDAQAQQALAPLLQEIDKTTDPKALRALAKALQVLPVKLTEIQAQQALEPLLQQINKKNDAYALQALAEALRAIEVKLSEAQAQKAFEVAMSSLAWAATEDEANAWARAVVALLPSAAVQDETRKLVSAMVYPTAAGPATEILLDALHARRSEAPAKEAGTAAIMAWIADTYPNEVHRSICPRPPQSNLKCPYQDRNG
jgi:hypothetical protein